MDWKQYEREICDHFRDEFPSAKITSDVKVIGRFSKVERQVDVLIEDAVAGFPLRIAIDAKHRNRPIDVTDVEAFIAFCSDIGVSKGVMIAVKGFTAAAATRVHYGEGDIELDVLNFADLKKFQGFGAIPFSGSNGVLLPAPFGWVVDGTRRKNMVASLYQRGRDFEEAALKREFMYVNFWERSGKVATLDALIAHQEAHLRKDFPSGKVSYRDGPSRERERTRIRCFEESSYPSLEFTGFVEFERFIFFCVLFTPVELTKRNLRKLDYVLRQVLPIMVRQPSS